MAVFSIKSQCQQKLTTHNVQTVSESKGLMYMYLCFVWILEMGTDTYGAFYMCKTGWSLNEYIVPAQVISKKIIIRGWRDN